MTTNKINMLETDTIDNILKRAEQIRSNSRLGVKLQFMDLLVQIQQEVSDLKELIEKLNEKPSMDWRSMDKYQEYLGRINHIMHNFQYPGPFCASKVKNDNETTFANNKRIIDYLFPRETIDTKRESAEKIRLAIGILQSKTFVTEEEWVCSLKSGLIELKGCLESLKKIDEQEWNQQQYEQLWIDLEQEHLSQLSPTFLQATQYYQKWKRESLDMQDEFPALFSSILKSLFDQNFFIVDPSHLGSSYKSRKKELLNYMNEEEITADYLKKFHILYKIAGHKNGRFLFNKSSLGKYAFLNRNVLTRDNISLFFHFQRVCQLAYADMNQMAPAAGAEAPQEQPAAEKPMPTDCKEAAKDFILPTFTSQNKGVLNSITQIKKAAAVVYLTKPVEVAMLMVIAKEVNAIKAKTTNAEFVRALIGIGLIDYINEKEITKKANGMTHYIQTNPEDKKKVLVPEHRYWKGNKQLAGKKIFEAMTTPDYQQG